MVERQVDAIIQQLERLVSASKRRRNREFDAHKELYRLRSEVERIRNELDSHLERYQETMGRRATKLLRPWREAQRRPAWRPVVESCDRSVTASKFSGIPWLADGEDWPQCGYCGTPLQLLLQLNLSEVPNELAEPLGRGLLQCFYCVHGEDESGDDCRSTEIGWKPFSKGKLVRLVVPKGAAKARPIPIGKEYFAARTVVEWRPFTDYPSPVEFSEIGLEFFWNARTFAMDVRCAEMELHLSGIPRRVKTALCDARGGDKLGGWPKWVQGVEYPTCPRCRTRMRYVFQIDSKDHVPHMFGDMGCGHITQCPKHCDVLTFSWACY